MDAEDDDLLVVPGDILVEDLVDDIENLVMTIIQKSHQLKEHRLITELFPTTEDLRDTLESLSALRQIAVQIDAKNQPTFH